MISKIINKPYPAFCRDCKHHQNLIETSMLLRCVHPIVNTKDSEALAQKNTLGSVCEKERNNKSWFAPCGMKGKLWEPKI